MPSFWKSLLVGSSFCSFKQTLLLYDIDIMQRFGDNDESRSNSLFCYSSCIKWYLLYLLCITLMLNFEKELYSLKLLYYNSLFIIH